MNRFLFGFYNPNHVAALACAIVPLCWGWMRYMWLGRVLFVLLCVMLALTQSRTGLTVLVQKGLPLFIKVGNGRRCATGRVGCVDDACIFMLPFFRAPEYFSKFRYLGVDGSGATRPMALRATTKAGGIEAGCCATLMCRAALWLETSSRHVLRATSRHMSSPLAPDTKTASAAHENA